MSADTTKTGRPIVVELNGDDNVRDVLEGAFPDTRRCFYRNCGREVSGYDLKAECRYCKHVYCRDHVDYRVHGCRLRL